MTDPAPPTPTPTTDRIAEHGVGGIVEDYHPWHADRRHPDCVLCRLEDSP